ncbi:hydroxylamine oxidation protein HaoB [Nitrosococcus oceani]|nr:hydroxylamine oxidation protein HaoB [Nitrosococcus oceani]
MSVAENTMPPSSKEGTSKALPLIGIMLIAGGLLLLGWLGWALLSPAGGKEAPYQYKKVAEGGVEEFPELGLDAYGGITVRKYKLLAEEIQKEPLVELYTGSKDNQAPVLLEWKNNLIEPLLAISSSIEDLTKLARGITEHVPSEAMVLSWWDTSRRLELLTGVNTLFNGNLAEPLLIPTPWVDQRKAIENLERDFWQVTNSGEAETRQKRVAEALLADEAKGVSILRELSDGREAYVVVHWSDAYKLGAMEPKRFGLGYKDFPGGRRVHALIPHVKDWIAENGYESYLVHRSDEDTIRTYFLTGDTDKNALIVKLLPFSTSNPMELEVLKLVAQYGSYWVYSLPPANDAG